MNGRRLRMARLRDAERDARCETIEDLEKTLQDDLRVAFDDWERMDIQMRTYDGNGDPRALTMARNLLQWRARYVYTLHKALENL